jgi:hypothetical protein
MLCYGFPNKRSPHAVLRFPTQTSPLASCGSSNSQSMMKDRSQSMMTSPLNRARHTTDSIHIVVPYRTHGGKYCPMVSTPKIWSLANSSTTCHDSINHLHHSNHCSNHNINPHHSQITSRWMGDHLSQRYKPNSISQRMERLVRYS